MGDIGSHAENLAATITGRHITHVSADVATVVPGRLLDDDAAVLLRLDGGVRGLLVASQIEIGNENNIRIRVHGSDGSLSWRQEDPNVLVHAPASGPTRELRRGNDYLSESAQKATRIPPGHPEGYLEAFANVYLGVFEAVRAKQEGRELGAARGPVPDGGGRGAGRALHRARDRVGAERREVDRGLRGGAEAAVGRSDLLILPGAEPDPARVVSTCGLLLDPRRVVSTWDLRRGQSQACQEPTDGLRRTGRRFVW